MLPLVTVGIISYNRFDRLMLVLERAQRCSYPYKEIIVVDNNSSFDTNLILKKFPNVKLVRLTHNAGVGARNILFQLASGKYIFQYDDDSAPGNSAVMLQAVTFLETHPEIDALCTNVVNYYTNQSETADWEQFASAGDNCNGFRGLFVHAAGMVFKTESIRMTKGYPVDFFWGFEEADLSLQMAKLNLTVVYKPDIITYHFKPSEDKSSSWIWSLKVRNSLWLFWKYFPAYLALYLTVKYLFIQALATLTKPTLVPAFLSGLMNGLKGIKRQRGKDLLTWQQIKMTVNWRKHLWHQLFWKKLERKIGKGKA